MNDWADSIRKDLQGELGQLGSAGAQVFGPLVKRTKPATPRQQLNSFLSMDTMQKQQLALEMGPEAYNQHVMQQIDNAAGILGPGAYNMLAWFQADSPGIEPGQDALDSLLGGQF